MLGTDGKVRACVLTLPHHTVKTPVFMPVGTQVGCGCGGGGCSVVFFFVGSVGA